MRTLYTWAWLGIVLAGAGCSSSPVASDPEIAQAMLKEALDAWQQGVTLAQYREQHPEVTVVEFQWSQGWKLREYALQGEPKPSGFDQSLQARLTLLDPKGQERTVRAVYSLSTHPKRVLIRSED